MNNLQKIHTRVILVGGDWNANGGRPSGFVTKVQTELAKSCSELLTFNGGHSTRLALLMAYMSNDCVVIWMPNLENHERKCVNDIKRLFPECTLVTSKRNNWVDDKKEYSYMHLIAKGLQSHSNLILEVSRKNTANIKATILDPLGNIWCDSCEDIGLWANCLVKRLISLRTGKRIRSLQIPLDVGEIPTIQANQQLDTFFQITRKHAETFHSLIHGVETTRFLGNMSFRCESGFPAFKMDNEGIWVSARNVDKRDIDYSQMVNVEFIEDRLCYLGPKKPSVDAPLQCKLFELLPQIKYMLHSHVYIEGATFTHHKVPCGDLREVDEILEVIKNPEAELLCVNLLGHGNIVMASNVEALSSHKYYSRPFLEA